MKIFWRIITVILIILGIGLVIIGTNPQWLTPTQEKTISEISTKTKDAFRNGLNSTIGPNTPISNAFGLENDFRYKIYYSGITGGRPELDNYSDWINLDAFKNTGWVTWGMHNGWGGDIVLTFSIGQEVVVVENNEEYVYIVNNILDDYKYGTTDGIQEMGEHGFALQSCHYGIAEIRLVSLIPQDYKHQAPSAYQFPIPETTTTINTPQSS